MHNRLIFRYTPCPPTPNPGSYERLSSDEPTHLEEASVRDAGGGEPRAMVVLG